MSTTHHSIPALDPGPPTSAESSAHGLLVDRLRRSEETCRALFEVVPHPMFVFELASLRVLAVNRAAVEAYGHREAEFLTLSLGDVLAAVELERQAGPLARLREGRVEDGHRAILMHRHRDGSVFEVEESRQVIDFRGRPACLTLATGLDASRQAAVLLAEQAALLDKATDAIMVRDLDDRIQLWYAGACRLYGYSAAQAVGQPCSGLLGTPASLLAAAREALLQRGEWSGELVQRRRDGGEVIVEARWTLVRDALGRPRSILAIETDVTDKRKLESQYLRAQRLESIGTMAGGIAHDLNNVLAPILMSITLLRERVHDPSALRLLEPLRESAERGAAIVRQVLSFARGLDGSRVSIAPAALLEDVVRIIRETFPRSIRIRLECGRDLAAIDGDVTQLQQVLLNLCVNARDAMPDGGELRLAAATVDLDEHDAGMRPRARAGQFVIIEVADTGTGIPPEIRDKVFEPSFTTKPASEGTGLGLPTALSIVQNHGGFVEMTSEVGAGTRFRIHLPAARQDGELPARRAGGELPRGNGELLLLVDDENAVLTITAQTLEAYGYQVVTAGNGAEAVARFAERPGAFAVVLTDLMMPVMDGAATIQALRTLAPKVRVIAASGLASGPTSARAQHLDVAATLTKPYSAELLLETLRRVLAPSG